MVQQRELDPVNHVAMNASVGQLLNECHRNGIPDSVMAFNIAKISDEERSRLYCRRFGYCNSQLLKKMSDDADFGELPKLITLNEDNAIMDAAKFKKKAHQRNDPEE